MFPLHPSYKDILWTLIKVSQLLRRKWEKIKNKKRRKWGWQSVEIQNSKSMSLAMLENNLSQAGSRVKIRLPGKKEQPQKVSVTLWSAPCSQQVPEECSPGLGAFPVLGSLFLEDARPSLLPCFLPGSPLAQQYSGALFEHSFECLSLQFHVTFCSSKFWSNWKSHKPLRERMRLRASLLGTRVHVEMKLGSPQAQQANGPHI